MKASIDMHTTTKEKWEMVFSVQSVPRLYNEDQLPWAVNQWVLRQQLEEKEVSVRWPPACKDMSPQAEERPLMEDIIKQHSEDHNWEH